MNNALIVGPDKSRFSEFDAYLRENGFETVQVSSGDVALIKVQENGFDLVITDENLDDITGLEFVKKLVSINPMINCAAVSSLSPEDYHENSEGLGLLMQLPVNPGKDDAAALVEHLKNIMGLTG